MNDVYFPYSEKEAKENAIKNRYAINEKAEFPQRLRELRNDKGETIVSASSAIGITRSTLGLYEKGENVPDVKTLVRIARHYGATVNYLLGEDDRPTFDTEYISSRTGLSKEAIQTLEEGKSITKRADYDVDIKFSGALISHLITSKQFKKIVMAHLECIEFASKQKSMELFNKNQAIDILDKKMLGLFENIISNTSRKKTLELFIVATKHKAMDLYGEFFEIFTRNVNSDFELSNVELSELINELDDAAKELNNG